MLTAVASITGVPLDTSNKPEVVIPTHKQSEDDDSLPTKGTYDDYRDVNKIDEKPVHGSAITDHSTRMSVQLLIIARAITDHSTQFMHEDVSAITDHSTQFMHMYDRVPHELLEDVSAITDHSTRQACPSRTFDQHPTSSDQALAVSQRQHILYQFIDRVLNGAQAGALVLDKLALLVLSTNRFQYIPFQYIPRVLPVLVGVRQPRRR